MKIVEKFLVIQKCTGGSPKREKEIKNKSWGKDKQFQLRLNQRRWSRMGECIVITMTWVGRLVAERKNKTTVYILVSKMSAESFLSELTAVLIRSYPYVLF